MNGAPNRLHSIVPWVCGVFAALIWAGCAGTAFLVARALIGGYCAPQPECGSANRLIPWLAGAAILGLLFGLAVGRLAAWALRRSRDAASAASPPLWAAAVAVVLGAGMLWIVSQFF